MMISRRSAKATVTNRRRRGAILIVAMICLMLLSSLGLAAVKTAVRWHRQLLAEEELQQAVLLADAARQRAQYHLFRNAAYAGETWEIPAADLGEVYAGQVRIDVKTPAAEQNRRIVTVRAVYPVDRPRHVTRTRQFSLTLPTTQQ